MPKMRQASSDNTPKLGKVMPCTCDHAFQDQRYGRFMRLHNRYLKPAPGGWRCTVCERTK